MGLHALDGSIGGRTTLRLRWQSRNKRNTSNEKVNVGRERLESRQVGNAGLNNLLQIQIKGKEDINKKKKVKEEGKKTDQRKLGPKATKKTCYPVPGSPNVFRCGIPKSLKDDIKGANNRNNKKILDKSGIVDTKKDDSKGANKNKKILDKSMNVGTMNVDNKDVKKTQKDVKKTQKDVKKKVVKGKKVVKKKKNVKKKNVKKKNVKK